MRCGVGAERAAKRGLRASGASIEAVLRHVRGAHCDVARVQKERKRALAWVRREREACGSQRIEQVGVERHRCAGLHLERHASKSAALLLWRWVRERKREAKARELS